MPIYFGPPNGGGGGGTPLRDDQAIVSNGDDSFHIYAIGGAGKIPGTVVVEAVSDFQGVQLGLGYSIVQNGLSMNVYRYQSTVAAGSIQMNTPDGVARASLGSLVTMLSHNANVKILKAAGPTEIGNGPSDISQSILAGIRLVATKAIVSDGQQITATNGQTISVAVADNVPSLTIKNWAFWDPFTVTVGSDGEEFFGYLLDDPYSFGSITNQPVNGFTLMQAVNVGGSVDIRLHGPHPIVGELVGALVGISNEDYSIDEMSVTQSNNPDTGLWINKLIIHDVPAWTTSQQIPIVIIPQNGG